MNVLWVPLWCYAIKILSDTWSLSTILFEWICSNDIGYKPSLKNAEVWIQPTEANFIFALVFLCWLCKWTTVAAAIKKWHYSTNLNIGRWFGMCWGYYPLWWGSSEDLWVAMTLQLDRLLALRVAVSLLGFRLVCRVLYGICWRRYSSAEPHYSVFLNVFSHSDCLLPAVLQYKRKVYLVG